MDFPAFYAVRDFLCIHRNIIYNHDQFGFLESVFYFILTLVIFVWLFECLFSCWVLSVQPVHKFLFIFFFFERLWGKLVPFFQVPVFIADVWTLLSLFLFSLNNFSRSTNNFTHLRNANPYCMDMCIVCVCVFTLNA